MHHTKSDVSSFVSQNLTVLNLGSNLNDCATQGTPVDSKHLTTKSPYIRNGAR